MLTETEFYEKNSGMIRSKKEVYKSILKRERALRVLDEDMQAYDHEIAKIFDRSKEEKKELAKQIFDLEDELKQKYRHYCLEEELKGEI